MSQVDNRWQDVLVSLGMNAGAYDMWLVAHTDCQICMEPLQQDPGDPGEQIINLNKKVNNNIIICCRNIT